MDLGKIMKEERIKQGMSQQKLAQKAGVTKRAIIYWENGEKKRHPKSVPGPNLDSPVTIQDGNISMTWEKPAYPSWEKSLSKELEILDGDILWETVG